MLKVAEHSSPQYPPRTYQNARLADLTVAIALDFNTAGERLTHRAAGDRYVWISLSSDENTAAEKLVHGLREFSVRTLNVAGNGICRLAAKGWTQERLNAYVYTIIRRATVQWSISKVISGGQTGSDLAGVTAAHALGIDVEATLPKGFLQRGLDNHDRPRSREDVLAQIEQGAAHLRKTMADLDLVADQTESPTSDGEPLTTMESNEPAVPAHRTPRLFNIKRDKDIPAEAVYIGRGTWRGQRSLCGNPFVIGTDGDRNAVCHKFEDWAPTQPQVMSAIETLRAKDLVCYCAPYRCHGEWIIRMANRELAPAADARPPSLTTNESFVHFDPEI